MAGNRKPGCGGQDRASAVTRNIDVMAETRTCEQCGASFAPRREHARFCSARCRVAWNRLHASDPPADTGALEWSITAMRETTNRLQRASGWDRADGFTIISEAVWWVTIVDAAMMRYHPDTYANVLSRQSAAEREITEATFAGLRFVRNQMGYHADPADFIQPTGPGAGATSRVAAWVWKPRPEPALASLAYGAREWAMERYQAYQAQLAGHPVGETFSQAVAFLRLAAEDSRLSRAEAPESSSSGAG